MAMSDDMAAYARARLADALTSTIRSIEWRTGRYYKPFLGAFWTLVDQGAVSLGTFLLNIQLARQLEAPEYGFFALLIGSYFIIQHLNASLISYPMMLRLAGGKEDRPSDLVFTSVAFTALSSLLSSAIVGACLFAVGRSDIAAPAAIYLLLWQLQDVFRRALLAELRHPTAAAIDGIIYIGAAGAIAVLAKHGSLNLHTALSAMTGTSGLGLVIHFAIRISQSRPTLASIKRKTELMRDFWKLGRGLLLSGFILVVSAQIFLWALAVSNGPAEVAAFQACLNIANLANPISFGLCNIILTTAAAAYQEGDLRKSWRAAQTYIIIGISLISLYALPVMFFPHTALVLLYGANSSYANFYHTLPIIVFAVAVNSVTDMVGTFIEAARAPRLLVWIQLTSIVAVGVGLLLIGLSVAGFALALAVGRTIGMMTAWYFSARMLSRVNRFACARPAEISGRKGRPSSLSSRSS
jgi:O-antigen/teichoic acid export membrane protein